MNHKKITYYLMILVTIVCLALSIATFIRERDTSCSDCEIKFKTISKAGMKIQEIMIKEKLENMYKGLIEDKCIIGWDHSGGYYRNG